MRMAIRCVLAALALLCIAPADSTAAWRFLAIGNGEYDQGSGWNSLERCVNIPTRREARSRSPSRSRPKAKR